MATTINADQTQTAGKLTGDAAKRIEETTERVKEFNSAVTESTKAGSRVLVDNYETAAKSVIEMQRKLAGTSQAEWVKNTSATQIQFAEDVTAAWVKAARNLLK